jgi:hypothetical protein
VRTVKFDVPDRVADLDRESLVLGRVGDVIAVTLVEPSV